MTNLEKFLEKSKQVREVLSPPDCGDNSCRYSEYKAGMRTNGGCRCYKEVGVDARRYVQHLHFLTLDSETKDEMIRVMVEELWNIRDNFDCDQTLHVNGRSHANHMCRCCAAGEALAKVEELAK